MLHAKDLLKALAEADGNMDALDVAAFQRVHVPVGFGQGLEQVLGVQHADDVLRIVLVERQPGMGRVEHFPHQLARRQFRVQHDDILAVDHDLGDVHLRQVQHAAQHHPVAAFHQALRVVVLDRAANLLVGGQHVGLHRQVDAEWPQHLPHEPLDGEDDRAEHPHHQHHRRGQGARHQVGPADGDGLG